MNVFLLIQALVATAPILTTHNCDTGYSTAKEYTEHCDADGNPITQTTEDKEDASI